MKGLLFDRIDGEASTASIRCQDDLLINTGSDKAETALAFM